VLKKTRFTQMIRACTVLVLFSGAIPIGASASIITLNDYVGAGNTLDCTGCEGFVGISPVTTSATEADKYSIGSSDEIAQLGLLNDLLAEFDPARPSVTYVNKTDGDGDGFTTDRKYFSIKKSTGMWFFENLSGGTVTVNLDGDTEDYSNWTEYGAVVPVPAAVWLFGTALIGFIGFARRTKV
jgi:hypothetical protein